MKKFIRDILQENGKWSRKSFFALVAFSTAIIKAIVSDVDEGTIYLIGELLGFTTLVLGFTVANKHKVFQKKPDHELGESEAIS